jgi:YrbI family 3-deoxy-D-manno-octulosonate 8-phosphate phosphatase
MERKLADFSRVKLLVLDFDGVLTDNRVYVNQDGREMVSCWRSDGIGLSRIREAGVKTLVISSEVNPVVEKRCAKLGIDCMTGVRDKLSVLKKLLHEQNLSPQNACFVGNDLPDIDCLKYVGYPIAVKGSTEEVLKVAKYITKKEGGAGAVREVCDLIYEAHKKE